MLTGKQVRVRFARNKLVPQYLDGHSDHWLGVAEQLLLVFRDSPGRTRGELTEALADLVEERGGRPLLVFYLFRHDLARIREAHPLARELKTAADVADWNAGKIEILVAHPASCGHGINLQGAAGAAVCWFGLPWSLELYQQANARVHRQGIGHAVVVHHLLVEDSIDQDVMAVLADKAAGQGRLLDALKLRAVA